MTIENISGEGGGGGCFIAGTKVSTPNGPINIEDIKIGDEVYSFDITSLEPGEFAAPGYVNIHKVTATFKHSADEVGNASAPLTINHEQGVLHTTINHYILTTSRKSAVVDADAGFVRADELQVGDVLYTRYGHPSLITSIAAGEGYDFVYNLEVEGDHTYIADKVRVHNGGGGKAQKNPVQANNTTRSNQIASVLLAPSEGPSAGLWDVFINGGYGSAGDTVENRSKSVYFGGTQLINSSGQYEFSNISVDQRIGLPSQTIIPGFSTTETEVVTGLPIAIVHENLTFKGTKDTVALLPAFGNTINDAWRVTADNLVYAWHGLNWAPTTGSGAVAPIASTGVITSPIEANVDAVRITIEFPNGLQKLDQKSGDTNGSEVDIRISRRITAGTWEVVVESATIKEMSSGAFIWATVVRRPAASGTFEIRIERLTVDSTSNYVRDNTVLKSYTKIQETKYNSDGSILFEPTYNNRGLVGVQLAADSTNGRVPAIALDWGGVLVSVPNNYTTRLYNKAGVATRNASYSSTGWGQTFKAQAEWTDNPAWVLYELMTNSRYGLGNDEEGAQFRIDPATIDKSSFYSCARYCDELIDNGLGTDTSGPRFTFNAQLIVRESAWKTLQTIAATFNAKLYNHGGMIRIVQDRPEAATKLINNTNVVGGTFSYAYSASTERYCQANVTYNEPADNFLPKVVSVTDAVGLARYGLQSINIIGYGVNNEAQALRAAKWAVDTSLNTTTVVSFAVSILHADFEPGQVFKLLDYNFAQARQEGAIISNSGTSLVLDVPFTKTGGTWTIDVIAADGKTIETRTITSSAGTSAIITVNTSVSALPGAAYIISGSGLDVKPQQFRIIGMSGGEDGVYNVSAVQYDENKYARIETGVAVAPTVYFQQPPLTSIVAPTLLVINPVAAVNPDGVVFRRFELSWTAPLDGTAIGYNVQWRKDDGILRSTTTTFASAQIDADIDGVYNFYINAKNIAGVTSPTLSGTYTLTTTIVSGSLLAGVLNLGEISNGSAIFTTGDLTVSWYNPAFNGPTKYFEVSVLTPANVVLRTEIVPAVLAGQTQTYTYTRVMNDQDGGPRRSVNISVRTIDLQNKASVAVVRTFTNPSPGVPTNIEVIPAFGATFLSWERPVDAADFEGVIIWAGKTPTFQLDVNSKIYEADGTSFTHSGLDNDKWYYVFAAFDGFAKDYTGAGMNVTSAYSATPKTNDPDKNKVRNSGFDAKQSGNRPTYWSSFYQGATSVSYPTAVGVDHGGSLGTAMAVQVEAGTATQLGIQPYLTDTPDSAGVVGGWKQKSYVISFYAKKSAAGTMSTLTVQFQGAAPVTKSDLLNPPLTVEYQRYAFLVNWGATRPANGMFIIFGYGSMGVGSSLTFDEIQVEEGTAVSDYTMRVAEVIDVQAINVTGQLQDSQMGFYNAAKLTGSVDQARIAALDAVKIAGQIAGTQILDGSISTPKLAVGSVQAANIAVGAVQADNIAVGAVTVGKMLVTGQGKAINDDPTMVDVSAWLADGPFVTQVDATSPIGLNSIRISNSTHFRSRRFPVQAGKSYKVTAWAKKVSGAGVFYLRLYTYNSAGVNLGYALSGVSPVSGPLEGLNADVVWTRYNGSLVVPSGGVTAEIVIVANYASTGATDVTDVRAEEFLGSDLFVDGTIDAQKLVSRSVTTNLLAAGAVTTTELAAGSVSASKIQAETITAREIAATSLTGDRFVANTIDATKLKVTQLSAITANLGTITAGDISGTTIHGGAFTSTYVWPTSGTGFHLSSSGLLIGNANTGPYFQVNSNGNVYSNQFSIVSGVATFSGNLSAAGGTFSGALSGASGTFSGSLTAETITAANIVGGAISSTYAASTTGSTASVTVVIPSGAASVTVIAEFGGIRGATYTGSGKDGTVTYYTRASGGSITGGFTGLNSSSDYSGTINTISNPTAGTYTINAVREAGGSYYYGKCAIVVLIQKK